MKSPIAGRYKLIKKVGSGSFGEVYKALDLTTNNEVAVKMEPKNSLHPQLASEANIYKIMQGGPGIPKFHWQGEDGDYVIMAIDLLGSSLEELFNFAKRKFSVKTVLMLADQMIQYIQYFHSHYYLHRDVKPDNFLLGTGNNHDNIYIIDYGLAKKYYNPSTQEHIPFRDNKNLTGTARYASIRTHCGIEQSRRDDLECIGYVLMYFLRGSLPWQGVKTSSRKKRYQCIKTIKIETPIQTLCRGFPVEFALFMNYCRALKFTQSPDYDYLKKLFKDSFFRMGYKWDYIYDWILPITDVKSVNSTEESCILIEDCKEKSKKEIIKAQKRALPFAEVMKDEIGKNRDGKQAGNVFFIFKGNEVVPININKV